MTEVVSKHLQLVSSELVVVPEHLVVARPAGPLNPLMGQQVEVPLSGVVYPLVHYSTRQHVAVLAEIDYAILIESPFLLK